MQQVDETTTLISASKVTGTDVYNTVGDTLGEIYDVMLDKQTGRIAYAIMSFGGFLGMGKHYHPLPWTTLNYDVTKGGYVVPMSKDVLKSAPTIRPDEMSTWRTRAQEQTIHDYYKTRPYWDA